MKIILFLIAIFMLSFPLLFWFFRYTNKKEETKDSTLALIVIASLFSGIVTLFFAFFLFLIIGSASVINNIFSLNIDRNQLIVIGISFIIYWFTIDNIFEKLIEYFFGETIYAIFSLALLRVASFYVIGILLKLNEDTNMIISIGVALIFLAIDVLYFFKNKKSL